MVISGRKGRVFGDARPYQYTQLTDDIMSTISEIKKSESGFPNQWHFRAFSLDQWHFWAFSLHYWHFWAVFLDQWHFSAVFLDRWHF